MRHIYLLANLSGQDAAERLAESLRRHLDGREDIGGNPRILVKRGRVNVEGVFGTADPKEAQKTYQDLMHRRTEYLSYIFDWTG